MAAKCKVCGENRADVYYGARHKDSGEVVLMCEWCKNEHTRKDEPIAPPGVKGRQ